jgi:hypothetical protein
MTRVKIEQLKEQQLFAERVGNDFIRFTALCDPIFDNINKTWTIYGLQDVTYEEIMFMYKIGHEHYGPELYK